MVDKETPGRLPTFEDFVNESTTTKEKADEVADDIMADIQSWLRSGLPYFYKSFRSYMYDFYPNLPWDDDGQRMALERNGYDV